MEFRCLSWRYLLISILLRQPISLKLVHFLPHANWYN